LSKDKNKDHKNTLPAVKVGEVHEKASRDKENLRRLNLDP
jgi:hypothetical protein